MLVFLLAATLQPIDKRPLVIQLHGDDVKIAG